MYDSVDPNAIPADADMVAGYIDGEFGPEHARFNQPGWDESAWLRFPRARHVRVAVNPSTRDGDVGDVETGDMTPESAVGWTHQRRVSGVEPVLYYNRTTRAAVVKAFAAANEPLPRWWKATLDGTIDWSDDPIAVQYLGSAQTGDNYDVSAVLDYWPGIDPDPGPPALAVVEDDGVPRS